MISQTQPLKKPFVKRIEGAAPATTPHGRIKIVVSLFLLYIIWGSTYLGMRIALEGFPPFVMVGLRYLTAGIILYTFLRVRGTPAPTRAQWAAAGLVGILLLGGGNGGVAFAEQWVGSGIAAVGIAAVPLWTALLIGLMGRWPTRLEWMGLGLGFLGVIFLNLEHGLWVSPIGAIALLLSPMCWALGTALSTRFTLPAGLMSSAAQMIIGGGAMLVISQVLGERMTHFPNANSLWAMGFLILFGSLIAFSAYGYLLRHVRPALATSYAYVNPVVAVGLGVWLAGEQITPIGIVAMLVILSGVGLVSLGRQKR
ncbi:MAG TPA: drug/metabolite exporter YedA [Ktedonobacteraceae bacterium]|jgi:drug/metabolite transporter (DMT)-like permease|nr:drug/metabolite exporter YedA [Ktedonobacteraceae bacterium]